MSGITQRERDRRSTEAFHLFSDRPLRIPINAVAWVASLERAYCPPCDRRDWGAQIVLTDHAHKVFRCRACLRAIAEQLLARAAEMSPQEQREAADRLALPAAEDLDVLRDLLSLADEDVDIEWLRSLTPAQRDELANWAARLHLRASDNPVRVPPRPACLPPRADVGVVPPSGGAPKNHEGR